MNYRGGRQLQFPRLTPVVRNLIIAFVVIQILFLLAVQQNSFGDSFALSTIKNLPLWPVAGISDWRIWQIFTYMWIHDPDSLMHLAFNMLVLYFFGPMFSGMWGSRDFLRFFIICGVAGGLCTVFLAWIAPGTFGGHPVLGASGAILGLIVAFGMKFPREEILLFFIIPVQGRLLIPITILVDLLVFASDSSIAIGAHWGGMLAGYLLISGNWRPGRLQQKFRVGKKKKARKKRKGGFDVLDGGKGPWIH